MVTKSTWEQLASLVWSQVGSKEAEAVRPCRPLQLARPALRPVLVALAAACVWAFPRGAFTALSRQPSLSRGLRGTTAAPGSLAGPHLQHPERGQEAAPSWLLGLTAFCAGAATLRSKRRQAVVLKAATAESVVEVLKAKLPKFLKVVNVKRSEAGPGLGLFSKRGYREGETIFSWRVGDETMLAPADSYANKLEGGDWAALAFQLLKISRTKPNSCWTAWLNAGVSAPATHPLKCLLDNPELAKRIWSSTTCGGRISSAALQMKDDLEALQGGTSLEEWSEMLALMQSRVVAEDNTTRPLLILGLDEIQDSEFQNCKTVPRYEMVGAAPLGSIGLGETGKLTFVALDLVATEGIQVGEELTLQYLPNPHGGGYMERYGFIPKRLIGDFAEACVELTFDPIDEEDSEGYQKEKTLIETGLSPDPFSFYFTGRNIRFPGRYQTWNDKPEIDKMVQILRLRNLGGADSFLVDAVYIQNLWKNVMLPVSKANELSVFQSVIDECDRWLDRFEKIEAAGPEPEDDLSQAVADIRKSEKDLLNQIKQIFTQELRVTTLDESKRYWVDRQLGNVFPGSQWDRENVREMTQGM